MILVLKFRSVQGHDSAEKAVTFRAGEKGLESEIYLPVSEIPKRQGERVFTLNYKACCGFSIA